MALFNIIILPNTDLTSGTAVGVTGGTEPSFANFYSLLSNDMP